MDVIPTTIAERIAALSRNAGLMTASFADYGLTSDEATAFQGLVDDAVTAHCTDPSGGCWPCPASAPF